MPRLRQTAVAVLLVGLMLTPARLSAGDGVTGEQAARDFSYKSVKIGSSLDSFRRDFPGVRLIEDRELPKTYSGVIRSTPTRAIIVEFYKGRVCSLKATVANEELQRIGGARKFKASLVKKFGPPHTTQPNGDCNWTYADSKLDVFFTTQAPGFAMVSVTDLKAHLKRSLTKTFTEQLEREYGNSGS